MRLEESTLRSAGGPFAFFSESPQAKAMEVGTSWQNLLPQILIAWYISMGNMACRPRVVGRQPIGERLRGCGGSPGMISTIILNYFQIRLLLAVRARYTPASFKKNLAGERLPHTAEENIHGGRSDPGD